VANGLYKLYKQVVLGAGLNLSSGVVKATLIDAGNYTVNLTTDQYMNKDTIPLVARVGSNVTLASKTVALGVFNAANITFTAVSGASVEAIVIWVDGGGSGTSQSGTTDSLVVYIDTGTNLPVTPNGGDIVVAWNASGIFSF
jgi:hypothetical protein